MTDIIKIPHYIFSEIPGIFYSDLSGKPFQHCFQCEKELIKSGENYIIEKAFMQNLTYEIKNTLFEYAMCIDCYKKVHNSFSSKSLDNMRQFFNQRVNFEKRNAELLKKGDSCDVNNWISNCLVNDSPINEVKEFQLACHCIGPNIIYDQLPYMISVEAMDEVIELISNETLGEMDDFKKKLTSPSPELEELFNRKKLLVV